MNANVGACEPLDVVMHTRDDGRKPVQDPEVRVHHDQEGQHDRDVRDSPRYGQQRPDETSSGEAPVHKQRYAQSEKEPYAGHGEDELERGLDGLPEDRVVDHLPEVPEAHPFGLAKFGEFAREDEPTDDG